MDKRIVYLTLLSLQVADLAITIIALQNPLNRELNPIPFSILIPVKVILYPIVFTVVMYSKEVEEKIGEPKRNFAIYLVLLFCSAVLANNLILWAR